MKCLAASRRVQTLVFSVISRLRSTADNGGPRTSLALTAKASEDYIESEEGNDIWFVSLRNICIRVAGDQKASSL